MQQEDALWPWLADGSMSDAECEMDSCDEAW
jgi:hypothetical protein